MDLGDAMYRVIADGIINQDADATKKAWSEIRGEADKLLGEIESILNEPSDTGLAATMDAFWSAWSAWRTCRA